MGSGHVAWQLNTHTPPQSAWVRFPALAPDPAACQCRPWEAAVVAQVVGSLASSRKRALHMQLWGLPQPSLSLQAFQG